ncbi:SDR family NAD(P)-dependent oxidoreductase [Helicobacter sp. 11S03491-1]|uniref:SDR family NAD(P)-dependent oxidoreductase n=1 Tax=Helicobacter sp. 11S03491-1 TaxID=1476196 RepID=UPI000BA53F6A|nr:SDR family NAD(P)-dependent oxidoreductase [Helicobacter sp. 11S03491-1]PAF42657.1 NAD(P)-dependent oxidoreductase [Helicobacter sp. 11S03491-1]
MVVLISGASAGFGKAIAQKFIKEGHQVIALARREHELKELQNKLGEKCQIIVSDVNDTDYIAQAIQNLPKNFQNIDVLVNNAGLALGLEPANKANIKDWEMMIMTNIYALAKLTHLLLPQMVARKKGHIINLGSIAGTYPYPGGNVYGATKAFVKQFSLNLRADLYDKNIRVSNIEPGLCGGSEFSLVRFKGDKTKANEVYKNTQPLLPQDIAQAVWWVVSLPEHVNINRLEIMPTTQAPAALNVAKTKK